MVEVVCASCCPRRCRGHMRPRRCRSAHAQAACIAVMCAWSGLAAFGDRQGAAAALHDAAAAVLPVFEAGAARAKQLDVVIAGCARDIAPHLAMVRGRLAMLKAQFRSATLLVFENGSTDGTRAELERWRGTGLIDDLLGWDLSQESRTTALAHARNALLDRAAALERTAGAGGRGGRFDYYIAIDMDEVVAKLTPAAVHSNWADAALSVPWSVACANQPRTGYYDLWALRTVDGWMPGDCLECACREERDNHLTKAEAYGKCVMRAARPPYSPTIPRDHPWVEVRSCFGGVAIYRWDKVAGCRYEGARTGGCLTEVCEHVPFNKCVGKRVRTDGSAAGSSGVYINPAFENS